MAAKGGKLQTTVRVDPDIFREGQYYLRLEGMSFTKFVMDALEEYVREYREAHPECVPHGKYAELLDHGLGGSSDH